MQAIKIQFEIEDLRKRVAREKIQLDSEMRVRQQLVYILIKQATENLKWLFEAMCDEFKFCFLKKLCSIISVCSKKRTCIFMKWTTAVQGIKDDRGFQPITRRSF